MSQTIEVTVPDIGDFSNIPVIEIAVSVGDTVAVDDALVTLESDKATMDVPSSAAGIVREIRVATGDRVSQGSVVAIIETAAEAAATPSLEKAPAAPPAPTVQSAPPPPQPVVQPITQVAAPPPADAQATTGHAHASPSVRLFARELGVDLTRVNATGPKGRILREDVTAFVKDTLRAGPTTSASPAVSAGGSLDLLPWPKVDFEKFGPIERAPLSRIKKISGANLARNWVMIPAVTYHDEADITELEAFRQQLNGENAKSGSKITMLAFVIKACQIALAKFPEFNSSLDGDSLILKKYFHIAFAADTPHGLVVPVIKNVDQKSVSQLAAECGELARKARDGKLGPADMSGACFTISSVGGIGGTSFSPIVNAPEVAILGISKSAMKPVWNGETFVPRLILPLSLSADHRVIDGALGTRFTAFVAQLLSDMRRALV